MAFSYISIHKRCSFHTTIHNVHLETHSVSGGGSFTHVTHDDPGDGHYSADCSVPSEGRPCTGLQSAMDDNLSNVFVGGYPSLKLIRNSPLKKLERWKMKPGTFWVSALTGRYPFQKNLQPAIGFTVSPRKCFLRSWQPFFGGLHQFELFTIWVN